MLQKAKVVIRSKYSKFDKYEGTVLAINKNYSWDLLIRLDGYDHGSSRGLYFSNREVARLADRFGAPWRPRP